MSVLSQPWSGFALLAARVDLWPVLRALGASLFAEPPPDIADLRGAGLSAPDAMRVAGTPPWVLQRNGTGVLRAVDPDWPDALRGLGAGPVALTCEGNVALLRRPAVAVVGARACTPYGRDQAARIARAVASAGGVVVSGLAAGVDVAAHAAAGGATIAVLGQGLDARMPQWQARVRARILEDGGLVLSELPPDAHADTFTFPTRNRIIAGLAGSAVVVVEAGARSGTRNTASHALRYGRDVLAVPGPLGAPASVGCLDLIEEGAIMVRGVETVLKQAKLDGTAASPSAQEIPEADARIARLLGEPRSPDDLVRTSGLPYREVMAALGMLEVAGRVVRLPGMLYQARRA